ncbi:MAG TPA: hypothetical protein VLT33_48710 [Labilithrix sp.]|nr:hypothetical protein [Labilithrix sp.]
MRLAVPFVGVALVAGASAVAMAACGSRYGELEAPPDARQEDSAADVATDAPFEAALPFCAGHAGAALCADFDDDRTATLPFARIVGTVAVDRGLSLSPPASARVQAMASTPAYLEGAPAGAGLGALQRSTFDLFLPDGIPKLDAVFWSVTEKTTGCELKLRSLGSSAQLIVVSPPGLDGGDSIDTFPLSAFPVPGRWSRVSMLLEATGMDASAVVTVGVTVDGKAALDPRLTRCRALAPNPTFQAGLVETLGAATGPLEAHYDNVLFEAR